MNVREDLHLHVAPGLDVTLAEHGVLPERRAGLSTAAAIADRELTRSRTIRMPRPPPPADAFTSTGNPLTSSARVHDSSIGTPASANSAFASSFEPMAAIALGGGPTHTSPASATAAANSAFSDRNP